MRDEHLWLLLSGDGQESPGPRIVLPLPWPSKRSQEQENRPNGKGAVLPQLLRIELISPLNNLAKPEKFTTIPTFGCFGRDIVLYFH